METLAGAVAMPARPINSTLGNSTLGDATFRGCSVGAWVLEEGGLLRCALGSVVVAACFLGTCVLAVDGSSANGTLVPLVDCVLAACSPEIGPLAEGSLSVCKVDCLADVAAVSVVSGGGGGSLGALDGSATNGSSTAAGKGGDTAGILAGALGVGCAGGNEIVMLGFAVCGLGLGGIVVLTNGSSGSSDFLRNSGTKMTANATTTKAPIKRCFSWLSKS